MIYPDMPSRHCPILPGWATFNLPSPTGRRLLRAYYAECRRVKRAALSVVAPTHPTHNVVLLDVALARPRFRLPPRPDVPAWTGAERDVTRMSRRDLHRIRRRLADARHSPWVAGNLAMFRSVVNAYSLVLGEIACRRDEGNAVYRAAQSESARSGADIRVVLPRVWGQVRRGLTPCYLDSDHFCGEAVR